eukprot:COSAG05_NODE_2918_length_2511_cov_2.004146_3_plen_77_part_01
MLDEGSVFASPLWVEAAGQAAHGGTLVGLDCFGLLSGLGNGNCCSAITLRGLWWRWCRVLSGCVCPLVGLSPLAASG